MLGCMESYKLHLRVEALERFLTLITVIETEMRYYALPLRQIVTRHSDAFAFLCHCQVQLEAGKSFAQAWQAGIAASAHKFSNDIRLLQHLKEVEEPFEKTQIGSSAMAYKRNPMRSERIASLSRYVMIDALNPAITSATQWFERTLDDSANKRLSIPEGFLAIDGILDLCLNVVDGLVVYPKVIEKHMMAELPFMATENIMMDAVKAGGDRQELHERIRELSMEAGKTVKVEGKDNNLLELIAADPAFNLSLEDLQRSMDPKKYIGRAKEQTERFVNTVVQPILDSHKELLGVKAEINV